MVGPRCEHLAHLLAWGIQSRMTVTEMLGMPFYHPVIEECLQDCLHQLAKKIATQGSNVSWPERRVPLQWRPGAGLAA